MSEALDQLDPVARPATLADQAREQLRAAIMAGRFDPGAKLTIRSVAKALDISLTPAREALYGLVSEGTLDLGANGTVFVPVLDEARVRELLVIRLALEGAAAREAVKHLNARALGRIRALNDRLVGADAARDYKALMRLNWEFHFAIYGLAGMPALVRMIEGCWLKTGSYLNVLYPAYGGSDRGVQNHADIIAALEAGDGDRLAAAVQADIETASNALLVAIRGRMGGSGTGRG
ncbi:GntR family transcriptional regulator [Futiania mangrovi]|uniref:GntR family transcriptional regulator n=1 Tax=Futiania mangrovi TaxID=2959716 RepID=A0A9J6PD58_9PROT|nr:GntR family transcriptional regulator [Futiania mangrovii]MCP1335752.1 GntR family transcriptional regulator [Futiania mangrovii]